MKNQTVKFKATGHILGNLWEDDGFGGYRATPIEADTESELIRIASEKLKDGSLDAGAGFESLLGALLVIEKITTIEIDGDIFTNQKFETVFIGDLTKDQKEWLSMDYSMSKGCSNIF
jgi:hypothetical protein